MTAKEVIKSTVDMGHEILTKYLSDLSDADLMVRAVPGVNHIAWHLGHLIASENEILTLVGSTMPDLPDGFAESHTKETSTSDDPAKFHTKAEYLGWFEQQRTAALAALDALTDADLAKPSPEAMREYAPTVGSAFNILGIHELMHAAQFVAVRRKLGKPVVI